MNKAEIQALIRQGLRKHKGERYGDILDIKTNTPSPADPEPYLLLTVPNPIGSLRLFKVTVTELEHPEGG